MALPRWATKTVGNAAALAGGAAGAVGLDDTGRRLNTIGNSIIDPNTVYNGPLNPLSGSFGASGGKQWSPVAPTGSSASGGVVESANTDTPKDNSGAYGAADPDAASKAYDLASLDEKRSLLDQFLSRTGGKLNEGLTQLGDDFNKETSRANQMRGRTLQDYQLKLEDTTRGKEKALGKVDTDARVLNDTLRRIVGRASGVDSTAYQQEVPNLVNRSGAQERNDVQEDYGVNFRNLDQGKKRASEDFENLLKDLADQKAMKEKGLRESFYAQEQQAIGERGDIDRQKAALRGGNYDAIRAAGAPAQGEIAAREAQLDQLFSQYRTPYQVKAVDTSTPNLRDYTVDRAAVGGAAPGAASDPTSPYSQFLKDEDEERLI